MNSLEFILGRYGSTPSKTIALVNIGFSLDPCYIFVNLALLDHTYFKTLLFLHYIYHNVKLHSALGYMEILEV